MVTFSIEDTTANGTVVTPQQSTSPNSPPQNQEKPRVKFSVPEATPQSDEVTRLPVQSETGEPSNQAETSRVKSIRALFEETAETETPETEAPQVIHAPSDCNDSPPKSLNEPSASHRQESDVSRKISMRDKTPFCRRPSGVNLSDEGDNLVIPKAYASRSSFVTSQNGTFSIKPSENGAPRVTFSETVECSDVCDIQTSTPGGRQRSRPHAKRDQTPFNLKRTSICTDDGRDKSSESSRDQSVNKVQYSDEGDTPLACFEPSPRGRQRGRRRTASKRAQTPFNMKRFSVCSDAGDKDCENMAGKAMDGSNKPSLLRIASHSEARDGRPENVESNLDSTCLAKKVSSVQFLEEVEIIDSDIRKGNSPRQSLGLQHQDSETSESNGHEHPRGRSRNRTRLEKRSPTPFIPRHIVSEDWEEDEQEKSVSMDPEINSSATFSYRTSASAVQSGYGSRTASGSREEKVEMGTQTPLSSLTCGCRCTCMNAGGPVNGNMARCESRVEENIFEWKPLVVWTVANLVGLGLMKYVA